MAQDKGLTCDCGFFTSHPDYMLTHLSEGNCTISDSQANLIRQRLVAIHGDQIVTRMHLIYLDREEKHLNLILQMNQTPLVRRPKPRLCHICNRKTFDTFGDRPQCARHIAGGDQGVISVLDEFLHGKD